MNGSKAKHSYWLILIFITFIFLAAGISSLIGNKDSWAVFAKAGYNKWFYNVVAIVEICGVIGLWIKKCRVLAILALLLVMIGAFVTQLINKDYLHSIAPVIYGLLLVTLLRQCCKQ